MNSRNPQDLEKFIHSTLRALPDRRAPSTLEHRVLGTLAARRALPWYRLSWAQWPLAARLAFLLLSAALIGAITYLSLQGLDPMASALATARDGLAAALAPCRAATDALLNVFSLIFRAIPQTWLYGALAVIGLAYLSFLGLGATAYRTLHAKH